MSTMPTPVASPVLRAGELPMLYQTRFAGLLGLALLANFVFVAGHDHQRILEIGVLLLGAAMALFDRRVTPGRLFPGVGGKLLAVFFLLGILGSQFAFAPRFASFEVSMLFLLYVMATMVGQEIASRGPGGVLLPIHGMAAGCVFYVFIFAVVYVSAIALGNRLALDDFTTGFSNIRFFNHTQTSTLPLLILLCCFTPSGSKLKWLWLAVTAYWWMALFATTGRGTLMGMAAACIVVAILLRGRAKPFLKQVLWTAALGLLAYYILLVVVPVLTGGEELRSFSHAINRTAADPASGRMLLWRRATALIMQQPWLGVGPMHFAHHAADLHIGAHPHNWLLQFGVEWGVPALLCLLIAIAQGLRVLLRTGARIARDDQVNQTIFAAMLAAAVAIIVDGLVSGLFVMPQSQLAIALYLGCVFGWQRAVHPAEPPAEPAPARNGVARAVGVAIVVVAAIGGGGIWQDVLAQLGGEPLTAAQEALNTGNQWPRLWKAGYF